MVSRIVAIDPGSTHVGVAMFIGAECVWAREMTPEELEDDLALWLELGSVDVVVCEKFQLYPWKSDQQAWSEMETCERIGVIKYICRAWGYEPVMQPASIKKPTFAILRRKKIRAFGAKPRNQHVLDAQAMGWHYLLTKGT